MGRSRWETFSPANSGRVVSLTSASRAELDVLMRKLLAVHRLLEAEERLAKRKPSAEPT